MEQNVGKAHVTIGQCPSCESMSDEVQRLKGALADLTSAHAATLDTYRRLSNGAIPNN